ncbi:hypothetical protein KNE206_40360 [Kitasatospora sp. NE20-6]
MHLPGGSNDNVVGTFLDATRTDVGRRGAFRSADRTGPDRIGSDRAGRGAPSLHRYGSRAERADCHRTVGGRVRVSKVEPGNVVNGTDRIGPRASGVVAPAPVPNRLRRPPGRTGGPNTLGRNGCWRLSRYLNSDAVKPESP